MTYRSFVTSQSLIIMAGSMVFPFYVLLLRNIGDSFSQFGWAYGLFALTSAIVHPLVGIISDRFGDKKLLIIYSWAMAALMLCFPIATEVWHVYILQVMMGCLGAVQRNTEKTALARKIEKKDAGYEVGKYHVWTSAGGAIAVIITGYLVDFLTIGTIFYIASFLYAGSAVLLWKTKQWADS
ncbi:MFS transporter [Ectobacillus panaciterrae]|uniref:MFS transporter n=1 Tax=Ectobacillus panaciterrae TaxID=363872 RepID=UPI0003FD96B3|nr:MFS transporter [Ectobacillus panaciterrae]